MNNEHGTTVSIIVPVYNVEKYLRQCIDSILAQTFTDFELILVDDGSTDRSGVICEEYTNRDSRVKVVHKVNLGLSDARNKGLDQAVGEYIAFVDADDWIQPYAVERALTEYVNTRADLVVFNFQEHYEIDYREEKSIESPLKNGILSQKQFIEQLCKKDGWRYRVAWNKMYKCTTFKNLRFPVGFIHEDEAIIHHVIMHCDKIAVIADKLYMYRRSNSSIMGSALSAKRSDILPALADRLSWTRKNKWREYEETLSVSYDAILWEYYHLFSADKENEKYIKRMENSLKKALPSVLRSRNISVSHKIYLTLLRLSPRLFWMVYRTVRYLKK